MTFEKEITKEEYDILFKRWMNETLSDIDKEEE